MQPCHSPVLGPRREDPRLAQRPGAAFSCLDLLTTIGVLALLALLLTPALARTRVTDYAFQCKHNMRRLILGWQMYAKENNGNLPNCFDWVPDYPGYLSYAANNSDNTNVAYLQNSALGPYVRDVTVFKCPADRSLALEGAVFLPRVRSVSMSQSFCAQNEGHLEDNKPGYYRHYVNVADMVLPAPANLWVMIDESPDSVNDAAFAVKMDPYGATWQDLPSILHYGGCGFAFADGHSEIHKWNDNRTLTQLKVKYAPCMYGLVQPNNADIRWLQDGATAPK